MSIESGKTYVLNIGSDPLTGWFQRPTWDTMKSGGVTFGIVA